MVRRAAARLPVVVLTLAIGAFAVLVGAAWTANWQLEAVLTGSMEPEVPEGALALTRPVSPRNVRVGDVVSYYEPASPDAAVLHRVIRIEERDEARFFELQGDANADPDALLVPGERIRNELVWHVPRLGDAVAWLVVGWRRWLLVLVPAGVTLGSYLRRRRRAAAAPEPGCAACPFRPEASEADDAEAAGADGDAVPVLVHASAGAPGISSD